MRFTRILIIVVVAMALAACSSSSSNNNNNNNNNNKANDAVPAVPTLLASGGTSTSGTGGTGGYVNIQSYGAVKVLKSGTVDAVFTVPTFTPDFGAVHAVVSAGTTTTVLLDDDDFSGRLCMAGGDSNLYIGNGSGTCGDGDDTVTGLTVESGAVLILVDQGSGYAMLRLANDMVINGTLTTDISANWGLDIEANIIDVESGGKIVTSATTTDTQAGEIWLGSNMGTTQQIINHGTIEAKGLGSGSGGWITLEPAILVVNTGTIDASGGDSDVGSGLSGGSGGELDVLVDYGDFYSSGIVRMNGGKGDTQGGDTEADYYMYNGYSVYVETSYVDNTAGRNGDIIISGTWEANGGDGSGSDGMNGRGGYGGWFYLQTDSMGSVTVNATMSAKGGDALAANFPGGNNGYSYGIDIDSYNWCSNDPATPGKISIAGKYDLRGGNGDEMGGYGGYFYVYSGGYNSSNIGSDVELVGFPAMNLNGGDGANGGSAALPALQLTTNSPNGMPAGPITNEANIEARGGNASATGAGGSGGNVEMITSGISDPSEIITNSGNIDISGGTGDTGGSSNMIWLWAQHVTNSGNLTANGGNGTTTGGSGGNIYLLSDDGTTLATLTGTQSVTGGTQGGLDGSVNIDAGGPL